MTIHYENTEADALAWYEYWANVPANRRSFVCRAALTAVVIGLLTFALSYFVLSPGRDWQWSLFTGVLTSVLWGVRVVCFARKELSNQVRHDLKYGRFRAFLGEHEASFTPQGIGWRSADGEGIIYWHSAQPVEVTPTHFVVSFGPKKVGFYPRRAFGNEAQEQTFLSFIEHHRNGGASSSSELSPTQLAADAPAPWYRSRYSIDVDTPDTQHQQIDPNS